MSLAHAPNFQNYLETYLRYLEYECGVSLHTLRAYHKDIEEFLSYMQARGISLLAGLKARDFRAYFAARMSGNAPACHERGAGVGARTQARKVAAIRHFFSFMYKRGMLLCNPAQNLRAPRFARPLPALPSSQDMARLFIDSAYPAKRKQQGQSSNKARLQSRALRLRDQAICEILYSSGMRISELLNVELGDVAQLAPEIKVMGKGKKERIVFLGKYALHVLALYLRERPVLEPKTRQVFINYRGQALSQRGGALCPAFSCEGFTAREAPEPSQIAP